MRRPNPEVQQWYKEKLLEIETMLEDFHAAFDRKSKKDAEKSSAVPERITQPVSAKSVKKTPAIPVTAKKSKTKGKNTAAAKKLSATVEAPVKTRSNLPDINAHKNRSQFWRTQNESAVVTYRTLTEVEKLERADRLKLAYEEELRELEEKSPLSKY